MLVILIITFYIVKSKSKSQYNTKKLNFSGNKNQSNLRSNENISNFNNNYISNSKQSIYNNQSNVNNNFPSDSQNNNLNDFKSSSIGLIQDDLITMSKNSHSCFTSFL